MNKQNSKLGFNLEELQQGSNTIAKKLRKAIGTKPPARTPQEYSLVNVVQDYNQLSGLPPRAPQTPAEFTRFAIDRYNKDQTGNKKAPLVKCTEDRMFILTLCCYLCENEPARIQQEVGYPLTRQFMEVINYGVLHDGNFPEPTTGHEGIPRQMQALARLEIETQRQATKGKIQHKL